MNTSGRVVAVTLAMYGTNHIKLNVLRAYPLCESACETGTGVGVPVPVPVLTVIDTSCIVTYTLIFIMKCYFETIFLRTYVRKFFSRHEFSSEYRG